MKTKIVLSLAIAGLALTGCSSTQNTTTISDSDSIAQSIMQDTMSRDTGTMDTTMRDTSTIDTTSNPQ